MVPSNPILTQVGPTWKKDFILFIVGMSAAVVGAYGPMLGPGFVPISAELGITVRLIFFKIGIVVPVLTM